MRSKEVVNTALSAVALAMAAASFALMILQNITGESYIDTIVSLLAVGLFAISVIGIRTISKN